MHCRNKLIHVSKKCHAATLTNDIARTIEVSTPAVMLGLSFTNDIKKKFSYMILLPVYFKSFRDLKYFKCHEHKTHLILKYT